MNTPLNPSPEDAKAAGKVTTIRVSQTELCDGWQKECLELRATNAALIALRDELVRLLIDSRSKFDELYLTLATEDLSVHDLRELRTLADQGGLAIDAALKSCADKAGGV